MAKRGPKQEGLVDVTIQAILCGRNKVPIKPKEVEQLAALGCTNKDIENFFGVAEGAIVRNFPAELTKGREEVKISLRRAMLNNACKNNNAAVQIFLAKNMLGMSDQGMVTDEDAILPWNND